MFASVERLFRHLVVYGSADIAALAINILLLPVFTRVLSPTEYGVLTLVIVLEAFLKVLFRWGFDTSFLRLHYDQPTPERGKALAGTAMLFLAAVNGVLLAGLWLAAPALARLLLDSEAHGWIVRVLALNLFVSNFHFLPLTQLRIEQQPRAVAGWTVVRSFGTIAARLVFVVGLRWSVLGFMLADLIVSVGLLVGLWPIVARMTRWRFLPGVARELLVVGLPRVPHGALHQIMAMADRFLLGLYLPLDRLGVYSIGVSIASLLKLYPVALTTAWTPIAFEAMARPDAPSFYARTATYVFAVMAGLSAAMILVADPILRLLTPPEYHAAAAVMPLLVLGLTIQAVANFASTALHIAKRLAPLPIITLVAAVASVVANVVLIPRFAAQGAALASAVGQAALLGATWMFVRRAYPIPYETGRLGKIAGVALVVSIGGLAIRATAPGVTADVLNGLLVAAYPAGLLAAGVFRPTEIASLREWGLRIWSRRPPAAGDERDG